MNSQLFQDLTKKQKLFQDKAGMEDEHNRDSREKPQSDTIQAKTNQEPQIETDPDRQTDLGPRWHPHRSIEFVPGDRPGNEGQRVRFRGNQEYLQRRDAKIVKRGKWGGGSYTRRSHAEKQEKGVGGGAKFE